MAWYEAEDTPDRGTWWWAVEHKGHPAFYLRSLKPGDFAPGRRPLPRHALMTEPFHLRVADDQPLVCDTCGEAPAVDDLDVIERSTGDSGFLDPFRGRGQYARTPVPWPKATNRASCWECGAKRGVTETVLTQAGEVRVCESCAEHLGRK